MTDHMLAMSSLRGPDIGAFLPGDRLALPPLASGLLDGLTFAVKDLIDVAGSRTGAGNPDWLKTQSTATESAPLVDVLLKAGATMTGKTITDELAFSLEGVNAHYGTPQNLAAPDRVPGGSSSGSASAVAAGLVDFALGTDTGGSVRVPASFVGICGFRPTHGALSLKGVVPFAPSYDTIGWFAREAATLRVVGEVALPQSASPPIKRLRLLRDAFALADGSAADALWARCRSLPIADEVTIFQGAESDWRECYRVLQGAEIWHSLGPWIESARPRFGDAIAPRFADAATITTAEVARWSAMRIELADRTRRLLAEGVGLVLPTTPCVALRKDAPAAEITDFYSRTLVLTSIAGHAGLPQVSLPAGLVDGCPIGLSIVAGAGQDDALLRAAELWANHIAINERP